MDGHLPENQKTYFFIVRMQQDASWCPTQMTHLCHADSWVAGTDVEMLNHFINLTLAFPDLQGSLSEPAAAKEAEPAAAKEAELAAAKEAELTQVDSGYEAPARQYTVSRL